VVVVRVEGQPDVFGRDAQRDPLVRGRDADVVAPEAAGEVPE